MPIVSCSILLLVPYFGHWNFKGYTCNIVTTDRTIQFRIFHHSLCDDDDEVVVLLLITKYNVVQFFFSSSLQILSNKYEVWLKYNI